MNPLIPVVGFWIISFACFSWIIYKYKGKDVVAFISDGMINPIQFSIVSMLAIPTALLIMPFLYFKRWLMNLFKRRV